MQETPHKFMEGDFVMIEDVKGMTGVNGNDCRPIRIIDAFSFYIEDTTNFKPILRETRLKKRKFLLFYSLTVLRMC